MATLLETFDVKEIAFEWDAVKRVFRNNELIISGDEDTQIWTSASRKRKHEFLGVWLIFQIASPFLQRVSPEAAPGNDWIDVKNAVLDSSKEVKLFPIYSLDPTLSYTVVPEKKEKPEVLRVNRALTYPEAQLTIVTEDQLDEYPSWLRQTRTRG